VYPGENGSGRFRQSRMGSSVENTPHDEAMNQSGLELELGVILPMCNTAAWV